jgi:hypothetical protein
VYDDSLAMASLVQSLALISRLVIRGVMGVPPTAAASLVSA